MEVDLRVALFADPNEVLWAIGSTSRHRQDMVPTPWAWSTPTRLAFPHTGSANPCILLSLEFAPPDRGVGSPGSTTAHRNVPCKFYQQRDFFWAWGGFF